MGISGSSEGYRAPMESVETDMSMTTAQRFAAWLKPAMRAKGMNIDSLRGGGKRQLAEAVGVSDSTVNRWCAGKVAPDPANYEAIAVALDTEGRTPTEATIQMLVDIGIISSQLATERRNPAVRLPPLSPSEAADRLGFRDPVDREMFFGVVDRLTRQPRTASDQDSNGGAAAEG
jgi:transcriptional regulator with XRE-family HTH domain